MTCEPFPQPSPAALSGQKDFAMTATIHRFPVRETEEPAREPLSRLGAAALIAMLVASVTITAAGLAAIVTMVLSWTL